MYDYSLLSHIINVFIFNEESALAFCCLFHGDITKLPTVLFIFSVVLYKLEHPEMRIRFPASIRAAFWLPARIIEFAAHWIITNAIICTWHLFYSTLGLYFTTEVEKEVDEPTVWPVGVYWKKTITKTEQVKNTIGPTIIGTLLAGYLIGLVYLSRSKRGIDTVRRRRN